MIDPSEDILCTYKVGANYSVFLHADGTFTSNYPEWKEEGTRGLYKLEADKFYFKNNPNNSNWSFLGNCVELVKMLEAELAIRKILNE